VTLLARFAQLWWGVLIGGVVALLFRKRLFSPGLDRIIEAGLTGEPNELSGVVLREGYYSSSENL
jgi:hypothetical protein